MRHYALIFALSLAACGLGEESLGISGLVQDTGGRLLSDALVQVQNEATGARWDTHADNDGHYSVAGLPAGRYKITVRLPGFRTVARGGVVLNSAAVPLDFALELLGLHQVITVVGDRDDVDPSQGDSLLVSRGSPGATLPTSSRDFRASFDLMPGVVVTPAGVSDAGQFTSNGQRPNASAFRVDGVSVNTGVGGSALPGSLPGASLPAMTSIGSTENLASPETTQSVELRTSGFAPEFGQRPGAEALVTTRAGSNQFHGEFFGHVRDNGWTARDWFANSRGLLYPRPYYDNLGGVFGGPILRNRTFIFVSSERSRLDFSGLQLTSVPSLSARQNAPPTIANALNNFPLPTGPDQPGGLAEAIVGIQRTAELATHTLRIDQSLGSHGTLFGRIVDSPSSSESNYYDANRGKLHWDSVTLGLTLGQKDGAIHDLRFNYSRARLSTSIGDLWGIFGLGGLLTFTAPPGLSDQPVETVAGLSIPGLGQFIGGVMGSPKQEQWEGRYTWARAFGRHQLRAGADYVMLAASRDGAGASIVAVAPSLETLLDAGPLAITYSTLPRNGARIHNLSLFAQDTVRATDRLHIIYGLRWEITPPTASAIQIPTVSGLWTGSGWQGAHSGDINGTAPWPMRYGQVAPRIGMAYRLPAAGLVLRTGFGLFYDTALGAAVNPLNGAPFNSWQLSSGQTGAGSASGSASSLPPGSANSPDVERFLLSSSGTLHLPASYQWRVSLDKGIGTAGVASLAYLGAAGRNLLGNEAYVEPDTGVLTRFMTLTANSSSYQALELRYSGTLGRSLYGTAAYTWSHSIDDGSLDSSVFLIHPGYRLSEARASSSFDVRQVLTLALSYRIPRSTPVGSLPEALTGWTVSGIVRARGGFPINVLNTEQGIGRGFDNVGRPDLVPGQPVWIRDDSVAGHRRLNPAAFTVPGSGLAGTLGRNAISGNHLAQLDMSIRREFALYRGLSLEAGVSLFNVTNHPSFADPVPYLSSPWFGQSTSMQNLMLGSGTPNTGLPPLFQPGGSRSAEVSFRISF